MASYKLIENEDIVSKIIVEYSPTDYLVVSKALKLLSENEKVNEIDRKTAKEMLEMADKMFKSKTDKKEEN